MAAKPETYTRTIRTMSEILDVLRDEPDPDGALSELADRIAVEREWARVLLALGEEPRRPPRWLGPLSSARGFLVTQSEQMQRDLPWG